MFSKSQAAFIMSGQRLFEEFPRIYLWTLTFKNTYPDWWYPAAFKELSQQLQTWYGFELVGLRVLEPHTAEYSHGLHYHLLVNKRIHVSLVRRLGCKVGVGRVQVCRCDKDSVFYLAKYLSKRSGKLAKGMRKWGTIGGFRQVKVNNIQVDSAFHRNMNILFHGRQTTFDLVHNVMAKSKAWGDYEDWPDASKAEKTVKLEYVKK